jgi:hypothetical protein
MRELTAATGTAAANIVHAQTLFLKGAPETGSALTGASLSMIVIGPLVAWLSSGIIVPDHKIRLSEGHSRAGLNIDTSRRASPYSTALEKLQRPPVLVAAATRTDPWVRVMRVADPGVGAGSGPEVVLVLLPPPGLGTSPCGRLWARRRPGRRPGPRGRPARHHRQGGTRGHRPQERDVASCCGPGRHRIGYQAGV